MYSCDENAVLNAYIRYMMHVQVHNHLQNIVLQDPLKLLMDEVQDTVCIYVMFWFI